jgi:hypothetical protein
MMLARHRSFAVLSGLVLLACSSPGYDPKQNDDPTHGRFVGTPGDFDYTKAADATQVILYGQGGQGQLVARTDLERIEHVLLTALSLNVTVAVDYDAKSKEITGVYLTVPSQDAEGSVLEIHSSTKDERTYASVMHDKQPTKIWTRAPTMRTLLETAARQMIPVVELAYDPQTMEITRGKLNTKSAGP